ncbi:MAG TPA: glycosyltransferase [Candidatus Gemmiger excrementipullorum]|uniref:Glycosyltransferase n=1 Tax=Candidatus Gemmiger excrementipullorum TaxID=2838610 RepID=A0A9D1Y1W0_9FIRM|nr:glycosyltransferase [Candidatus Gemmiger excrementipullorum]
MSRPAVCVVVPVYRAEATLDRCVQSILAQDVDGGLACILVDDGSPDESGALCDAWAARDTRVRVIHQEDRGVSGARNSGLAAADSDYLVFLDADDALRPGALQAALNAQRADPAAFVLWQYTTDAADPAAVTDAAAPYGQQALARLWLDCVLAMPWNKLYRTALAQRIKFDETYTLGEDLQFVLDYIALLGQTQPGFTYRLLQSPLTFYDCSHTGSLSTRYHANYCEIWPEHFAKLNAACLAAACPERDLRDLHRAELTVYAEGVADILRRDPTPLQGIRRDKAAAALRRPWLRALLDRMRQERCYSAYYLPCRWRSIRLVYAMAEAKRAGSPLYGKLDWAGYYLLGGRLRRD